MLWAVEALAEPIAVRLRFHFASSSGSMNQPEHPEWLFQTALRYARGLAPALEGLQEIVTAHGLHETYHLPFELARALRSSVQVTPLAAELSCEQPCFICLLPSQMTPCLSESAFCIVSKCQPSHARCHSLSSNNFLTGNVLVGTDGHIA